MPRKRKNHQCKTSRITSSFIWILKPDTFFQFLNSTQFLPETKKALTLLPEAVATLAKIRCWFLQQKNKKKCRAYRWREWERGTKLTGASSYLAMLVFIGIPRKQLLWKSKKEPARKQLQEPRVELFMRIVTIETHKKRQIRQETRKTKPSHSWQNE